MSKCFIKCYCDAVIQIKLAIIYSPYILTFSLFQFFSYISALRSLSMFSSLCPAKPWCAFCLARSNSPYNLNHKYGCGQLESQNRFLVPRSVQGKGKYIYFMTTYITRKETTNLPVGGISIMLLCLYTPLSNIRSNLSGSAVINRNKKKQTYKNNLIL